MADKAGAYVGIDLGGTNIQCGILDAEGAMLARDGTKTKAESGADAVIKRLTKLVATVVEKAGLSMSDVAGLGIGAPGAIDVRRGVVLNAVNLRWRDYPLGEVLSGELNVPVVVDNDVNVGAWGEHMAGAGRGYDDMLGIFVGTGIGGGLVLGGRLYHGAKLTAGEIGHTIIQADAAFGRQTVESLASRTAVANLLRQLILANHPSAVTELTGGNLDKIRSKVLSKAYAADDPLVTRVLDEAARYIGITIANAVTLLALPCVVVGGGVTEALDERWMQRIRESFLEHVFPEDLRDCRLVASELEDDAGPVGAALLARDRLEGLDSGGLDKAAEKCEVR